MLAQKTAEVDALLRDNENLRAFIQENVKQPVTRENAIYIEHVFGQRKLFLAF